MSTATIWHATSGPDDAPLLALVHGSMDRSAGLLKLSRRLDRAHHVLRYDRRGYGRSQPHPGPFSMDGQVADLESLVGDRQAIVVGHSYGGNVALAAAARASDRVRAVVVYEAPLSWLDWWPDSSAGSTALADGTSPADAAERFMRRLIGDARWERLPARTREARRAEGAAMMGELADLRSAPPWRPEQITVPVLVLHGEHGAEHHQEGSSALAGCIDGAELVEIAGARHFGPNTHPDEVAGAIGGFLDDRL